MQGSFIWYELLTTDMTAAGRFYRSVIGWDVNTEAMGGDYQLFEVPGAGRAVGGMMLLTEEMKRDGVPPNWTGYVEVDDVDAMAARFRELGGTVRKGPAEIPGIGRFAVVADPQGAVILIFKPYPMENAPPPVTMSPGFVGWHELYAADGAAALDFYGKVFGWTRHDVMDMGAMGKYYLFAVNGQLTGGMMDKPTEMPMPAWGYYFIVDDIDAACRRVKDGGGTIVEEPMEVPDGFAAQARDPQGAWFGLAGPRIAK